MVGRGRIFTWGLGWALVMLALVPAQAERLVRLSAAEQLPHLTDSAQAVLREAYGRLQVRMEVTFLPLTRGLLEVQAGHFDGDLARVASVAEEFPSLLRVPTAVGTIDLCAHAREGVNGSINTLGDLSNASLKIGVRHGSRLASMALGEAAMSTVRTYPALFEMLSLGRIDVAVVPCGMLNSMLPGFEEAVQTRLRTVRVGLPLESQPLYHFLNKRNADLLAPLDRELAQMRKDGTIKRIWSQ